MNQDFHIHDLNLLATYCSGWDLQDLLLRGFGGVSSKVESKPPKHLRPALGQIVNFFYTLQGESSGAQAMSNFDTFLAPFIRKDNLDYKQLKQSLQEFAFNCMVPTRVGFQCLSEDTEILTKEGWKKYNEVREGDIIKTFNLDKKIIEEKKVKKIFKRKYEGKMYRVLNSMQDQLISPGHRMVRRKFNINKYCLDTVEDVIKLKTPQIVAIAADNKNKDIGLSDEEIKLIAWIISKGSIEVKKGKRKLIIYRSRQKKKEKYKEIISLLSKLKIEHVAKEGAKISKSAATQIILSADSSKKALKWFDEDNNIKTLPQKIIEMSQRQSRIFLETYLKANNCIWGNIKIWDEKTLNDLQRVIVNAGYGFATKDGSTSFAFKKPLYLLRVVKYKETKITQIKKVDYSGVIWSVNTDNETVVAKRKENVFITGNTPFLNISLDVKVPEFLKNQPIIIGGEPQDELYGDFQKEMDMFNQAFYEVLMQGDSKGRVFTFPIPTISITKDFDWDNPALDRMWEATAKYGINYFSNFVQSDMNPEDFRSMCLCPEEELFVKEKNDTKKLTVEELFNLYCGERIDKEWFKVNKNIKTISLNPKTGKTEWAKINKFLRITDNEVFTIESMDGKTMNVSKNHLVAVFTKEGIKTKKAKEINEDDYLLTLKDGSRTLNNEFNVVDETLARNKKQEIIHQKLQSDQLNLSSIDRWGISNKKIEKLRNADYAVVKVKRIRKETLKEKISFYDIELDKNHYFVHSDGNITHNCCRLRLDNKELIKRGGGLFGSQPLTGSVGVATINLPRIGYLSKTKDEFYNRLSEMMDLAKDSLELKRKVLDNFIEKGLYPYTKHYLASVKKLRNSYFGNHFSTIGLIGMNEALLNFMKKDIASKEGREFAVEVLQFMRKKLTEYQEETGNLYNLEATPGEGASFRQARVDREKYKDIITAGTPSAPYYTNSVHLPVNYSDDPFEVLDLQDELQTAFTGGTVVHLYLGERVSAPDTAKKLVKKVFDNYHLPYITISPTFSICQKCGYIKGEALYCPNCKIKEPKKVIKKINNPNLKK